MKRLLQLFDGMNRRLRWLLFLPAGLIIAFIITGLVDEAFNMAAGGRQRLAPGLFELSALAFVAAFTRTLFPAIISPRAFVVGLVIAILDTAFRAVPVIELAMHDFSRARVPFGTVILAAGVVGGGLALFLIRRGSAT
jgi:hypothetical protein